MRGIRKCSLGLTLALLAASARADEIQWRPAAPPAAPGAAVSLRRPVPLEPAGEPVQRVAHSQADPPLAPRFVRAQSPDPTPPPPPPPRQGNEEAYNCGVVSRKDGDFPI